jgi:hypothetical protein
VADNVSDILDPMRGVLSRILEVLLGLLVHADLLELDRWVSG